MNQIQDRSTFQGFYLFNVSAKSEYMGHHPMELSQESSHMEMSSFPKTPKVPYGIKPGKFSLQLSSYKLEENSKKNPIISLKLDS